MNAFQPLSSSRIRTFAVTLASLGLAGATPALAMTEAERCNWKADKVEARYAKCLARSATRLSNVLDGSTEDEDEHCEEQFDRSMDVLERRATFKDVGPECLARISEDGQNAAQAEALVAAGRDLDDYPDLGVDDLAGSAIQGYLDQSYDAGYDAGVASTTPDCDPEAVNLLDFEFYENDAGYWCGDATLLNRDGAPVQSDIFPYPYGNYKVFWVNDIQGSDLENRTLALYPPLSQERCDALEDAGIPNALGSGVCGANGAGKIYISAQEAADCSGTLKGVFPVGSVPLFSEATLLTSRIQTYRQEYVEGGVLLLDGITTVQNGSLVTNGQIWDPRELSGLDQLYGSYYDRMRKCTRVEFLAEIAAWSHTYDVPAGETCGIDSGNQPSGTTCAEFFDVTLPTPFDPSDCRGPICPVRDGAGG